MAHQVVTMDYSCRLFQFCISFIMVGVTCAFGFIGNTLSILALHRDSIKSVRTFLLSALAVADIMFLVPAVFVIMVPTYCEFYQHCTQTFQDIIPYLEQFGWAIASTCHTCTVYVTVLVAIHRYFWVCKLNLAHRFSGKCCLYTIIINISHCITTKLYLDNYVVVFILEISTFKLEISTFKLEIVRCSIMLSHTIFLLKLEISTFKLVISTFKLEISTRDLEFEFRDHDS